MRRSPTWRLVSLKVPEASTATYASSPLPIAVMAGKAAQTSREMPAKISFLRPVASMVRATRASSNALAEPLRTMFLRAGLLAQSRFPTLAPSKIFFRWEVVLLSHPLALDRTQHVSLSDQQQET